MSKYVSINPASQPKGGFTDNKEFAALINVKASRYAKREYEGANPKVAIQWTMGTTKGNTFERMWSTGIPWEDGIVSEDGKRLTKNLSSKSDAHYFLQKAINEAGFPSERITDDISVFENETFFMAMDQNPHSQGSARKIYPKKYHPEGWDAALEETLRRRAEREAGRNDSTEAVMTGSYQPPQTAAIESNVVDAATTALTSILTANNNSLSRNQIPAKLNSYFESIGKGTDKDFRQPITYALWDKEQLTSIVNSNPQFQFDGETVSLKQ